MNHVNGNKTTKEKEKMAKIIVGTITSCSLLFLVMMYGSLLYIPYQLLFIHSWKNGLYGLGSAIIFYWLASVCNKVSDELLKGVFKEILK